MVVKVNLLVTLNQALIVVPVDAVNDFGLLEHEDTISQRIAWFHLAKCL